MTTKPANHYIDNEKFYNAIVERQALIAKALEDGTDPPRISDYLGKTIYDLCTNLSYWYKFINYSYRQDMVSDAIQNCIEAIDKFDTTKFTNTFGYYNRIAFWAFLRRIEREKDEQYIKYKLLEEIPFDEMVEIQNHETGETHYQSAVDYARENCFFNTKDYEDKKVAKKERRKTKPTIDVSVGEVIL